MSSEPMVAVCGVDKSYSGRKVIHNLSFSMERGEMVGLLGPNGAGKTTTVRLLNGVLFPEAGTISVAGCDPVTQGDRVRRMSGVLTESAGLYPNLTAEANLAFFGELYGVDQASRRAAKLIADFGLNEARGRLVGGFSTGMKKRLGIARALLHEPEILFLDEPTTGLDPEGARDLIEHIARLNRERQVTILLCTHLLRQVEHLCHRFIFLHDGRVIEQGTLPEIETKYLGEVNVKVETGLAWNEPTYRGWPVEERGEGYLVFRVERRERIPDLLRDVLTEAPVYSAEIVGRDLETLYFKVRSAAHE